MRLTRYAPARMLCNWAADIPDRFDRILPESLRVSVLDLKRGGGAKSSAVNVPDFRRACLNRSLVSFSRRLLQTVVLTGWASPRDRQTKKQAAGGQEEQVSMAAAHL